MATIRIRSRAGEEYEIDDDGNIKAAAPAAPKGFVSSGGAGPGSRDPDEQTPDLHVSTLQGLREHTTTTPEQRARKLDADATASHTDDPGVQAIAGGVMAAGAGAAAPLLSRVLPAAGRIAAASPRIAQMATGALEGATASKVQGGDATTGAVLGAIPGAAGAAAELSGKAAAGAEERGAARAASTIEERTTKRTKEGLQRDSVEDLIREDRTVRKAAGNDEKLSAAVDKVKKTAGGELDSIYSAAPPKVDLSVPTMNMDRRIAELQAGNVEQRTIARHLQDIRDEFADSLGSRDTVSPRALRDEQSAYQKAGYAKNPAADPDVSARIAANREASKAVGDSVIEHVTGLDYKGAIAAAEENPDGIAARLLKANDRYSAANRIEAAVEDRARSGRPQQGAISKAIDFGKHIQHSPLGTAIGLVPSTVKLAAKTIDRGLARAAPIADRVAQGTAAPPVARAGADALLTRLIMASDSGDRVAQAKLSQLAQAPLVAARIDSLRRKQPTEVMQ